MLTFLGTGAAYNYLRNNTSAFFVRGDALFLFDCGEKICDRMLELGILSGVERVNVFVTHFHSDHVGSLEPLIYYIHYFTDKSLRIFYPDAARLRLLLELMGINFDIEICGEFQDVDGVRVECVPQVHIEGSYGYFVYCADGSFFYSGDTSEVNKRAVGELKSGKIALMYHEVTVSPYSMIHTHLSLLEEAVPAELRSRVVLMHLADERTEELGAQAGFTVANEI